MDILKSIWAWMMAAEIPGIVHLIVEMIGWVAVILFLVVGIYFFK